MSIPLNRLSGNTMQPEESPLFADLQFKAGTVTQPAHFIHAVYMHISMAKQVYHRHFYMVKEPPYRGSFCRYAAWQMLRGHDPGYTRSLLHESIV